MIWVLLGAATLLFLLFLGRRFVSADPRSLLRTLTRTLGVVLLAVALFLVFARRFALVLPVGLVGVMLLFGKRIGAFRPGMRRAQPSSGQRSTIETATLRMSLDHDSAALDGEILKGPFEGRRLADLSRDELFRLLEDCLREDAESAPLVETYLDRAHAGWRSAWRGPAGGEGGAKSGAMSREEAFQILGLQPGASPDEIKRAHRRLMKIVHPDQGGSTYLAARINQAKDILLG